jgi:hypothetical protein
METPNARESFAGSDEREWNPAGEACDDAGALPWWWWPCGDAGDPGDNADDPEDADESDDELCTALCG